MVSFTTSSFISIAEAPMMMLRSLWSSWRYCPWGLNGSPKSLVTVGRLDMLLQYIFSVVHLEMRLRLLEITSQCEITSHKLISKMVSSLATNMHISPTITGWCLAQSLDPRHTRPIAPSTASKEPRRPYGDGVYLNNKAYTCFQITPHVSKCVLA